jgi:hypothetical protein
MPIYLEPVKDLSPLYSFKSVLIAPCPVCPAVSMAIQQSKPYMEFMHSFLKTGVFEEYLTAMKGKLAAHGVNTGVFTSYLPLVLMCLWSEGQRQRLSKRAQQYDAVVVVACDAAAFNVSNALKSIDRPVFQAMQVKGIVTAVPVFDSPFTLRLKTPSQKCISWPKQDVAETV